MIGVDQGPLATGILADRRLRSKTEVTSTKFNIPTIPRIEG
jgi:hypothetical protein